MEINGTENGKYYLITITGSFDSKTLVQVRDLIDQALQKGFSKVVFDMSSCNYIDSSALGLLVSLYKKCKDKGGKVGILNPSTHIKKILAYANMDVVLALYQTEADMKKDLQ